MAGICGSRSGGTVTGHLGSIGAALSSSASPAPGLGVFYRLLLEAGEQKLVPRQCDGPTRHGGCPLGSLRGLAPSTRTEEISRWIPGPCPASQRLYLGL